MSCPPRDSFQIGWICALPIETAAATEMLDEDFGILGEQDAADSNTYRLGRIGKHHVVIAGLPQYGNTSATTVATNMLRTFSKSLKIGLMVGIGGGIPSAAHDIRLGDIVISYPQDTCGGVIQYDMGKVVSGGGFDRTGSLNSPPRALLTAVNAMRAAEMTDEPQYLEYLQTAIQRTSRTRKNFSRPTTDRLFQSTYDHSIDAINCDGCLFDKEEIRSEREDDNPQTHYGIIASGNSVIKNANTRDQIGSRTSALCFEMEAAGLMVDFPCIVIRGICDYSDSHKNKQWQGYAALAAASYSKELLGYAPVGQIAQEVLATDICGSILKEIKGTSERLDRAYDQQKQHHLEQRTRVLTDQQRQCHQLLKVVNYVEQKNINPKREQGTCEWALKNSIYIRWLEGNGPADDLLFVSADPGCGKSVLARSVIDGLKASGTVTVCYFFFKDNDEQNRLSGALCSVLHQLFSQCPHLITYAIPAWDRNGDNLREEIDELWHIFFTATSADSSHKTICIFDALDECREIDQARLIEKLTSHRHQIPPNPSASNNPGHLKFLVTARPYDYIENHFRGITRSGTLSHLRLKGEADNDQIREEIDKVVKVRVNELAKAAHLSSEIQSRLEQQLLQMKNRTYLWLHLAINSIRNTFQDSLRPAEESIELIPPSVNAAYQTILASVPPAQASTAKTILKIIVGARRQLTIGEMAVMLGVAVSPQCQLLKDAALDVNGLELKIRRLCGLFVFIERSKIYLIHQTAKEFLLKNGTSGSFNSIYPFSLGEAHGQLSEICIRYLLMKDFETANVSPQSNHPSLLVYSAEHWADHVRSAPSLSHNEVNSLLVPMYDTSTPNFSLWFPIFWKRAMRLHEEPKFDAIHLAAFNGHDQVVQTLVASDKRHVNKTDGTGSTGLIWASRNGHIEVVKLLMGAGSNSNAKGGRFGNALYAACSKGHEEVARKLLDLDADVNARCRGYHNVKRMAPNDSDEDVFQTIHDGQMYSGELHHTSAMSHSIEHTSVMSNSANRASRLQGGSIQSKHDTIMHFESENTHALYAASSKGHMTIVQILLEKGANVNAQGGLCENALQGACIEGHSDIVRILLEWGADPNRQGLFGSPLYIAAAKGHDLIVSHLIEYGADCDPLPEVYAATYLWEPMKKIALPIACFRGHGKIVEILLKHGADTETQDYEHGTALQAAYTAEHVDIMELLLEHGADANTKQCISRPHGWFFASDQTILHSACFRGQDKIVKILLMHGADFRIPYDDSRTMLQNACAMGKEKIVQLLLEHGADVSNQGVSFVNPLQEACFSGHARIVRILLAHGADPNTHGDHYRTALHTVCATGKEKIVQILLEHGADPNIQGSIYGSALQEACSGGHDKVVQLLLTHGADPNIQNGNSKTVLQIACAMGKEKIVQLLLEHGADVNTMGTAFEISLQRPDFGQYEDCPQMLLEHDHGVNLINRFDDFSVDLKYQTALQAACYGGHENVVQILLAHGADVNIQGGIYGRALQEACSSGHDKAVQLLLTYGANPNIQDGNFRTVLQIACAMGKEKIVQMLLKHGAKVNTHLGSSRTALQAACYGGFDMILYELLYHGADVNVLGGNGRSALQEACSGGHHKIVQILLEHGADPNIQKHITALQIACSTGRETIVQMLLERGAYVNVHGGPSGTPLYAACYGGFVKIVQMLLDYGAHVDFHPGATHEHPDFLPNTLGPGGDLDGSSLQTACSDGDDNTTQMSLGNGADDLAYGDSLDDTPLLAACLGGYDTLVHILLDHGANINIQCGPNGRTALQAAYHGGHNTIVQMLLEYGADPNMLAREFRCVETAS